MKIRVYSDLGLFGPNPYSGTVDIDSSTILLGDIVDLANCSVDKINSARRVLNDLIIKSNYRFASGDKERMLDYSGFFIKDKIYAFHGDRVFYGIRKYVSNRKKKIGSNEWYRLLLYFVNKVPKYDSRIRNMVLEDFYSYAYTIDADTLIFGHKNPKSVIDVKYRGKRFVCVPSGLTEVEI